MHDGLAEAIRDLAVNRPIAERIDPFGHLRDAPKLV
jgi:hypothetical protein